MLKITNLQKTFNLGTINAKTALAGFDLTINEGDFVTVIGDNGAGKSTMLNAISGVWKPDFGKIEIDGVNVTNKLVTENNLTPLMITHNMHDAITYGNRLIMMSKGKVVVDVSGEEKKKLTIEDLLGLFEKASGSQFSDDKLVLSK